jgi:hypothetical protein
MASKSQPTAPSTGTVEAPNPFRALVLKMANMAELEANQGSGMVAGEDIIPILTAETEEEMWDADELSTYNAKTLSGCEIQIYGFGVKFGQGDDPDITTPFTDSRGRQMYLLVRSARISEAGKKREVNLPDVGQEFIWNTSARNIVGKLFWMLEHGWFDEGASPVRLRIEGTALSGKRSVEKLKPLTGHSVTATAEPEMDTPLAYTDGEDTPPF